MDITTKTVRGIGWSGITQVVTQGFQLIVKIILARLLIPGDFGIIGMALIFTALIQTINELGLSAAIIQRKDINEKHLSTSFWLSIVMGIIFFAIVVLASPFIADFFKEELVQPVLSILSIGLIIGSFGVVHRALLHKKIDFKNIAITEIVAAVLSGITSITLALNGFGVWSLVIGSLVGSFVNSSLLWIRCSWRPSLTFDLTSFKVLFGFGKNVMGSRFLNYISSNMDYLMVGKFLSITSLGLYTLAYQIAVFPHTQISASISRVTFPAFSTIQDDNGKLRVGYLKALKYTSLITLPMLAGLATIAPRFIPIVLGERWTPMVIPLQILCVTGAINSLAHHVGSILLSKGRSDIEFKWNVFTAFVFPIAILIGVQHGITGVATAVTVTTLCLFLIIQIITNRLIDLSLHDYFKSIYPAAVSSTILVASVLTFQKLSIFISLHNIVSLLGSIIIGIIFYFSAIWMIDKDSPKELVTLIKKARGK